MMNTGDPCPVTVRSLYGGKSSLGVAKIQTWTKKQRTARILKSFATCWGLAIFSVAIPILHFFLVPGFLLAGPVMAWFISGQASVVLGGESTCPECGIFLPIVRSPDQWPLKDLCSHCQKELVIEKSGAVA